MFCLEAWSEKMRSQAGKSAGGGTRRGDTGALLAMASQSGPKSRIVLGGGGEE